MAPRGSAFGLTVHASVPFPELYRSLGNERIDVFVHSAGEHGLITGWRRDAHQLVYGYRGEAQLVVDDAITLIHVPGLAPSVARLLVLGTGMALALHRRGLPVLHGTTVRVGDADLMVCGPSGTGKSTFTAALLRAGGVLVADDVGAVEEGRVRPGLGRIKLWADAARWFGHDPEQLKRVHPDFDKYSVTVERVTEARPLRTIVVLTREQVGHRRLSGQEALLALLANHRVPEILTPSESADWMSFLGSLLRDVEVLEVGLPGPLTALDAAVGTLLSRVTSSR